MMTQKQNMITEDYVSFEIAKLLKDKGFDESIETLIRSDGEIYRLDDFTIKNSEIDIYSDDVCCPTLQMACEWLRQKHNIHITTEWYYKINSEETNDRSVVYISYIDSPTNPNIDFETNAKTEPQEAICEALCIALNEI